MSYAEKTILADSGGTLVDVTASNALKVDGSAVTQPVSLASSPLPIGAATEATLANIKTAVEVIDNFISGSRGLVTEDNSAAIKTAVETIDNFISGSRGLVTEDNSAAILAALGTIITSLAGTLTISGSVTANAGTNLNTSALALEATLQSVKTAVELIDDAIYSDGSGTVVKGIAILGQDGTNPQAIKTDSNGELQIDVLSSALPTGASTLAEQQSQTTLLTSIDGGIPAALGQTTMANSMPVVIASNQSPVDVNITGGSVTIGSEIEIKNDAGNPVPVNATDLDIRDLTFAADKVDVSGSTVTETNSSAIKTAVETIDNTVYTEGDTDATITGNASMMEAAGNTLVPIQGTVADGLLVNLGANNDITVTSSALPTGASTAANQSTIIGHVDGIESLLTTIDADTSTIAGAVSGNQMQVFDSQGLAEQQELAIIAEAIQELVSRLDFLPSVRGIAADLRVTLLSGVVTTVSTVTTVTTVSTVTSVTTLANQTNMGGFSTSALIQNNQNNIAIISNINNVL